MKIYKYIYVVLLSFLVLSCDKNLDIVPQDVLDAEIAITSIEDVEKVLLGAYATLRRDGLYQESMFFLPDLLADNLRIGQTNGGSFRTEANWQYSSGDDIDVWDEAYTLIFRSNSVIENANRFEDSQIKNRIKGQAYALRALAHFDLLRYYGEEYGRNSERRGVPVVTSFSATPPARETISEVYDQIFDDLFEALVLLGDIDKEIQEDGPHLMDLRAVNALLARVSLYAEQWQDAADYASEVISSGTLSNPTEYASMWSDDADGEVIFSVRFATADEGRLGNSLLDNGRVSSFTLTVDAAELYDQVNDVRYNSFVLLNPGSNPGDDVYLPNKYPGRGGQSGLNNAKILRLSEMYLIRAEANANIVGQDAAAVADLNELRRSRITGYVDEDLTGEALDEAIQLERRKELMVEGHRWFDLRRINGSVERGADCRGLTVNCVLLSGDHRFVFPIPQDEILANPNMRQSDGY
ncbi:RagB/SusD family nutrient uptake outer membrane protein [Ekhidna sp.]